MKKTKLIFLIAVSIFILSACGGNKASKYYTDVDNAISAYDEYYSYKKSAEGNVVSSDDEKEQNREIALLQADALFLIDDIKSAYNQLSNEEKNNLLNYIRTEHDAKYNALADWLTKSNASKAELVKAIDEGKSYSNTSVNNNYNSSIKLSSGNYTVPKDITAGTYDIIYVSGIVPSVDITNNGANDLYECFSESNKSFRNLKLSSGAKITIESGTVEFRKQ